MGKIQPKVIFLDAVGTLFGVKGSVGENYNIVAKKFGVESESELLNSAFFEAFKNSSPLAFPNANKYQIQELEFQWWKAIAHETFTIVGLRDKFSNFDDFFLELYIYFTTPKPWEVYPDTVTSLKAWQKQGIELGIISNFDTRIYKLLEILGLKKYFFSITISSTAGASKPDAKIFRTALGKHNCLPEQAWYIGDSIKEDYFGAKSLGIKSFLIER